ncbi:MAG: hypothetical protein M1368_06955 [Thaumarchaeota archaeon]|nr:hypothetical protein [Nitrososphaerota archaeon]
MSAALVLVDTNGNDERELLFSWFIVSITALNAIKMSGLPQRTLGTNIFLLLLQPYFNNAALGLLSR